MIRLNTKRIYDNFYFFIKKISSFNYSSILNFFKTHKKYVLIGSIFCITLLNTCNIVQISSKVENQEDRVAELESKFKTYGSVLDSISDELKTIKSVQWDLTSELAQMREGNYQTLSKVKVSATTPSGTKVKGETTKETLFEKADSFDTGRSLWESKEIARCAKINSDKYSIPIHIIYTLMGTESSYKYDVKNPIKQEYGRGLMQVSDLAYTDYKTAHPGTKITKKDLETSIECNMEVGCWVYAHFYDNLVKKEPKITWKNLYCAYNVGCTAYLNNKSSFLKGWDPIRNQSYNALDNWENNYKKVVKHFFC